MSGTYGRVRPGAPAGYGPGMADDGGRLHRELGAELFNRTWELIEERQRSADDDVDMLLSAAASRWHWGQVGGPEEVATGDWQVAHVASLLGLGELARVFARHNLDLAISCEWDGWRLASAHEGMARALAACGDADGREHHIDLAIGALERERSEADRAAIASQLRTVPPVTPSPA